MPGVGESAGVVLVEGDSDRAALETVAARRGLDLASAGTRIVVMSGITNVRRHLGELAKTPVVRVGGLYDAAEERFVRRGLDAVGWTVASPAERGFFACVEDLEDEFIRAMGSGAVLDVVASEGELAPFEILQGQPAHRDGTVEAQLHRFMGSKSGRKERYGGLLAAAVPLDRVPEPLDRVLDWVTAR